MGWLKKLKWKFARMKNDAHTVYGKSTKILSTFEHPNIVLVGQPNCGKSTIFNKVAGYKSISTNFPGATVNYTQSHISINNKTCDLVDLPGIYSLTSLDPAAEETKKYLLTQPINALLNIIDASLLSRSLELTLQLLELNLPIILCLNMVDEATRKGITIDIHKLSDILKIPVVETIGSKGQGIKELFSEAFITIKGKNLPEPIYMSKHVEETIFDLSLKLEKNVNNKINFKKRLLAIKLLENDPYFLSQLSDKNTKLPKIIKKSQKQLSEAHGQPADAVISSERHSLSMNLFEKVAQVKHAKKSKRDNLDDLLMHPVWGYVIMGLFLYTFFNIIFKFGEMTEGPLLNFINTTLLTITGTISPDTLLYTLLNGFIQGLSGGIAIVLPYLVPFLIGMALIEDVGYLPRIAFLMDRFMHKIGLHGTAVIPALLGYGCSVPAVMATRILSSPRDRFIASVVSVLIPCSARMTVIFGLVGFYLGGTAALAIYILNIFVIAIAGSIMAKILPEDTPGMVLEIPAYQIPNIRVILSKTWLRMKDFIIIAWPLLIAGSLILSLAEWYHFDSYINTLFSPITYVLGLPAAVGTTLIFGILRKELSMLMLIQAMGTTDIQSVMSPTQILVFTLFVVFYIPCLATIGILIKEINYRKTAFIVILTTIIAFIVALFGRVIGSFIF